MDLIPVANRLEFASLGEMGKTIFVHFMPIDVTEGILLRNPFSGTQIDYELPGYFKTQFTVIVRVPSSKIENGIALMNDVMAALTFYDEQVEGMTVKYFRPCHKPLTYQVSDGGYVEMMVRIDAVFTE